MLSFINAALYCAWVVFAATVILWADKSRGFQRSGGYWDKQASRIRRQASAAGVSWSGGETAFVWILSLCAAGALYFFTGNLLLVSAGWLMSLFLPRVIIQNRKYHQRLHTLTVLTDCLRQLQIRLPDQGSLSRAMEMVIAQDSQGESTLIMRAALDELRLGGNARDAIGLWKNAVGLRKFDHVAETLIQSNADGWTPVALRALDKSIEALEADLRAVRLTEQKAAGRRKKLYSAIAMSWSFPLILSMMDTGQKNLYLYSTQGKILVFAYVITSLYALAKGREYLSLNVEEL